MDDLVAHEAAAWRRSLAELGAPVRGRMIICGTEADRVAAAWHVLGYGLDGGVVDDEPITPGRAGDHVGASFVALLHAWASPRDMALVSRTAAGWLEPGGMLLLAELDVDRLRRASAQTYLSAMAYRMFPAMADDLASLCVNSTELVATAIRTGLDDKRSVELDRPRAVYGGPEAWRSSGMDGWRGVDQLTDADAASLRLAVARLNPPSWPLVDREPWIAVAGRTRF